MARLDLLQRNFSPAILRRGGDYHRNGHVIGIRRHGPASFGLTVRGEEDYEVRLNVAGTLLFVSCDCPYLESEFEPCKHVWASILYAESKDLLSNSLREVEITDPDDVEWDEFSDEPQLEPWLDRFHRLQIPQSAAAGPQPAIPEEIRYLIRKGDYSSAPGLNVEILGRSRKKSGEWGVWKSFRLLMGQLRNLDPFDRETIGLLQARVYGDWLDSNVSISGEMMAWWIERLAREGRLMLELSDGRVDVAWDESQAWQFQSSIKVDDAAESYTIEGVVVRGNQQLPAESIPFLGRGVLIVNGHAAPLELSSDDRAWLKSFLREGAIKVPRAQSQALRNALVHAPRLGGELPDELSWQELEVEPVPRLVLQEDRWGDARFYRAELIFLYGKHITQQEDEVPGWQEGDTLVRRKPERELEHAARLDDMFEKVWNGYRFPTSLLATTGAELIADGWEIMIDTQPLRVADGFDAEVTSGIDWFDLGGAANFGEETVQLPELIQAVERKQQFLTLADGSHALVPVEWTRRFSDVARFGKTSGTQIRFQPSQAMVLDTLLGKDTARRDETFIELLATIRDAEPQPVHESEAFGGELREYQREGLGWLEFCRDLRLGGCLADDMGLGKTVQMLAFLQSNRTNGEGPSLVVAPRSLMFNWRSEAERFAPELTVVTHHGSDRETSADNLIKHDIVLTTYGTLRRDAELLRSIQFENVILDEAQAIKNAGSQVSKVARTLKGRHRFALTGTPVENHLGELWSLFDFLNPGMLGSSRSFQRSFASKSVTPERRQNLGKAIRPFILRRTKEQVAPELPSRTEQTLYCDLSGKQKQQYAELRDYYRGLLLGKVRKNGLAKSKIQILEALLRLRQAACHPALIDSSITSSSAKLELLFEEVEEVIDSGHRALIFSQFTSFLALARAELDEKGIDYCYLDGKTRKRDEEVDRFQSDDGPPLFLISLKAGGLGLNLTNADYVFLLDPWWNPAVEAQAIDRAHRIGQSRPVVAHRIIARDTVEERILALQETKRDLAESIITADNSILRKLELEDLELLLS